MTEARRFLEAVFRRKPDELFVLIWTLQDRHSRWARSLDEAVKLTDSLCDQDLYIGVALSPQDFGPHRRCKSDQAAGIFALCADVDLKSAAHPKPLPATVAEALSIFPREMPPTFVVITGNGVHAWWLFEEPLLFSSAKEREDGATLALQWQTLLARNGANKGWWIDRVGDLARVLRVPGAVNTKDPANHKPVTIYSQSGRFYKPADFRTLLKGAGIGDPQTEERAAQKWLPKAGDTLIIDPHATIPADVLEGYLQADARFRQTWNKQREDLGDKSQSGYDLALAHFGMSVRMGHQQIVDLIVHHRRHHGRLRSNTLDYYQRTISKAEKSAADAANGFSGRSKAELNSAISEWAGAGTEGATPLDKARLCEEISAALEVKILRISKLAGQEPVYFLDLERGRLKIPNVRTLITQRTLREAIAGKTSKLIPNFRPAAWKALCQAILNACIEIDGTDELELEGEARSYIWRYLAETQFLTPGEIRDSHSLRPVIRNERILISSPDLQMFINRTTQQNLSVREVSAMIAALDARSTRFREPRREQSRWILPIEDFDPKDCTEETESGDGE